MSDLSKICSGTVILCKANEVMEIYMMNGIKLIVHLFAIIASYLKQIIY